jgi:3',5'-cyclic AMP phosphodiesterase CpdA
VRYRILHVSDLHTGPPHRAAVAERLVAQAHEIAPDLLVISGDFVQRADFAAQWRAARALRDALPQPQLVVPGNHDVPLFLGHLRMFNPLGRYRRQISPELNPVFALPGMVVVGASTAQGFTTDGGWLSPQQAAALRQILGRYGPETFKIVVWHHPVMNPPGAHKDRRMRGADAAIRLLDELDVALLLSGHLHFHYVGHTRTVLPELTCGTIICQSGTTTSKRGHEYEKGQNSCNLIELDEQMLRITPWQFDPTLDRFVPRTTQELPRSSALPAPLEPR